MRTRIPLGERESQRLEFKAAQALSKPIGISREAVAMLNAGGGEIWIGLREDQGIAVEAQGVAKPESEKLRLLDHLMETVEPRPRPGEIEVDLVPLESPEPGRRALLRLRLEPGGKERRPYALLHQGGRHYVLRVDHRMRPMTREEIFQAASERVGEDPETVQLRRLRDLREEVLKRDRAGLWISFAPVPTLELDVQRPDLEALLRDPTRSGNREGGWNFSVPEWAKIGTNVRADYIERGIDQRRNTRVYDDGCVEFWTAIEGLHHRTDDIQEIYPKALLEYPISVARLAARIYAMDGLERPWAVQADVVLLLNGDWHLPAYPPGTAGYRDPFHGAPGKLEEGRFLLRSPLRFSWEDFAEHPDHAGYLLVRQIYQAFGQREDRIPQDYDRSRRRLIVPG